GAMAKMEGLVREAALDCLNSFRDRKECEFNNDFSFPFPVGVAMGLLGLPKEHMVDFQQWQSMIFHSGGDGNKFSTGVREAAQYLRKTIAERKNNLGDDLISLSIRAEVDGQKMNDEELLGYAFNFFIGGLDTVTAHLNNFIRY